MKLKTIFLLLILAIPFIKADYVSFNLSMDGDIDYNSKIDTQDQYSEVNLISRDSHLDMSYWLDYEQPQISINQYPTYNYEQITKKTANHEDIIKTIGNKLNDYSTKKEEIYPNKLDLWFNDTLTQFSATIISKIGFKYLMPIYQELEFQKRKNYYMEQDVLEMKRWFGTIHNLDINLSKDSYDCMALKSMMKEGMVKEGSCSGQHWISDKTFIVSFNGP